MTPASSPRWSTFLGGPSQPLAPQMTHVSSSSSNDTCLKAYCNGFQPLAPQPNGADDAAHDS